MYTESTAKAAIQQPNLDSHYSTSRLAPEISWRKAMRNTPITLVSISKSLVLAIALSALAACGSVTPALPEADLSPSQNINTSLETMAKLFAQAVTDEAVRQEIHTQVGKRFDGDTEVLYQTLAPRLVIQAQAGSRTDIRSVLASAYQGELTSQSMNNTGSAFEALDALTNTIPKFQVAVPVHFDEWDAKHTAPLVGYMPVGVEDTELTTIKAFDAAGKEYLLDAQTEPEEPVIILGVSERTDDEGNLLPAFRPGAEVESESEGASLTTQACYNHVYAGSLWMYDDKEPWSLGAAELMLIADSVGTSGMTYHGGFREADYDGRWYQYSRYLGCTGTDVIYYWYEDDSGSADITAAYGGVSLGVKISNGDDFMGAVRVNRRSLDSEWYGWNLGSIYFYSN